MNNKSYYYRSIQKEADPHIARILQDLSGANRLIAKNNRPFVDIHMAQLMRSDSALVLLNYFKKYHSTRSLSEQETLNAEIYDTCCWLKANSPYDDIKMFAQENIEIFRLKKTKP
jgi:hypothetical protein